MKKVLFLAFLILPLNLWGAAFVDWSTDNPTPDVVCDSDGTTPLSSGALIEVWNDAGGDGPDPPDNVTNDVLIITTVIDPPGEGYGPGKFYVAKGDVPAGTYRFFIRAYNRELRENSPYYNNSAIQVFNVVDGEIYAMDVETFSTTISNPLYTAIELISFDAEYINGYVYISWKTGSEVNTAGFNIIRDDGISRTRINSSIIPPSFKPEGSSYYFIDSVLPGLKYLYYLEEVERDGRKNLYGPVSVEIPYANGMEVLKDGNNLIVSMDFGKSNISYKDGISVKIDGIDNYNFKNLEIPIKTLHFGIPHSGYKISIIDEKYDEVFIEGEIQNPCFPIIPFEIPGLLKVEEGCFGFSFEKGRDGFSPPSPVEIAGDYIMRAQRVLKLNIYPVRFSQSSLKIYKSIKFKLYFDEKNLSPSSSEKFLESIYKGLVNYEEATSLRTIESTLTSTPPIGKYIKVSCEGDGIFSFQRSYILESLDNPSGISLESMGTEWKYYSDNEKVYTYLPSFKSYWTENNVLFIKEGRGINPSILSSPPRGGEINNFDENLLFDDDLYLFPAIPVGDDGELWYMAYMFVGNKTFNFHIPYVVEGEPAELEISLFGYMDIPGPSDFHHIKVFLNNSEVCDITWKGKNGFKETCDITSSLLSGDNVLKLNVLSDGGISNDIILLDSVRFHYKRSFQTSTGEIRFKIHSSGDVRVCCFDSAPMFLKIGNGIEGIVKDYSIEANEKIAVKAYLEPGEYIVTENEKSCELNLKTPKISSEADLVIIGPMEFRDETETLMKRREREGLKTAYIDVDDLYDIYNYGRKDPSSIKSFIRDLMEESSPSYILLVGDGSYDPRDIFKTGKKDHIPAKFLQTAYMDYHSPSDTWYSAVLGDDIVPDVAIGRIPAETPDELKNIIGKITLFEDLVDNSALNHSSIFLADSGDGGIFIENMENLMGVFPSEWTKVFLSYTDYNGDKDRLKGDISSSVKEGVVFFNYSGHGSFDSLSKSVFYTTNDMMALENFQPFILLPQDCLNGYFVVPFSRSMGEAALLNPNGGAVSAWVSSGFTTPPPQLALAKAFYKAIFENGAKRLGDAVIFALGNMDGVGGWEDVVKTWVLLGDPSMRLSPIHISERDEDPERSNGRNGLPSDNSYLSFKTKGAFGCSIPSGNTSFYLLIPIFFIMIKKISRFFPYQ